MQAVGQHFRLRQDKGECVAVDAQAYARQIDSDTGRIGILDSDRLHFAQQHCRSGGIQHTFFCDANSLEAGAVFHLATERD